MNQDQTLLQTARQEVKNIGPKLRAARQDKGLTQPDLEKLTGISYKTISSIEVGRIEPSISHLIAFAQALEEPVGYFLNEGSSSVISKFDKVAAELNVIRALMEQAQAKDQRELTADSVTVIETIAIE